MEKNNKGLLIVLVIVILGLVGYIVYDKVFLNKDSENNKTKEVNKSESKTNLKINKDLGWVYDADYKANVKAESYTLEWETYNINDYKAPYINIDSPDAKAFNAEIKSLYDQLVKDFNEGIETEMAGYETFDYKYALNDNILSILLKSDYIGTGPFEPNYYGYNINIETGKKVSLEEILKYTNRNSEDFYKKAEDAVLKLHLDWFKDDPGSYDTYYEVQKKQTLDELKKGIKQYYLDTNKNISFVASLFLPYDGIDPKDRLITIE